jgi:hypothetical protein
MPSFMTFNSLLSIFKIRPTNPATDLGIFTVKGEVTDSRLITEFSFSILVYNTPPKLKENIKDLTVYLGNPLSYKLPTIEDEEGLAIKIKPLLSLPAFVEFNSVLFTFTISPYKTQDLGRHAISICFTDFYSPKQCEQFGIIVEDPNSFNFKEYFTKNNGKITNKQPTEKF